MDFMRDVNRANGQCHRLSLQTPGPDLGPQVAGASIVVDTQVASGAGFHHPSLYVTPSLTNLLAWGRR